MPGISTAADHLGISRAFGVGIDGSEIIGLLDAGANIDRNRVEQLFPWRSHRVRR